MSGVTNGSLSPAPAAGWIIRRTLPDDPVCVLPRSAGPGAWLLIWLAFLPAFPVAAVLKFAIGAPLMGYRISATSLAAACGGWAVFSAVFCTISWLSAARRMAVSNDWLAWRRTWSRRWRIVPFTEITSVSPARSQAGVAVRLTGSHQQRIKVRFHELRAGAAAALLSALSNQHVLTDETKAILSGVGGPAMLVPSSPALVRNLDGPRAHHRPGHARHHRHGRGHETHPGNHHG